VPFVQFRGPLPCAIPPLFFPDLWGVNTTSIITKVVLATQQVNNPLPVTAHFKEFGKTSSRPRYSTSDIH
jgi:hypothetical protein